MRAAAPPLVVGMLALAACAADRGTIGAVLGRAPDGSLTVRDAPSDLAAAKAGLGPGDQILLVDGRDVRSMSDRELRRVLGGDVGTTVKLTIVRGEEVIRVTLKRTRARKRLHPAR